MFAEQHLLLILHAVPRGAVSDGVVFHRDPTGTWQSTERGGLGALKALVTSYEQELERLESSTDRARSSDERFAVLGDTTLFERAARHLHAALQSAREQAGDKVIIGLRDRAEEVARRAELAQRDAKNGLEHHAAREAEAQTRASNAMARASHRLNMLMATLLPLTALGSMLGMNMRTGMEGSPAWVFWGVFTLSLVAGAGLAKLISTHAQG